MSTALQPHQVPAGRLKNQVHPRPPPSLSGCGSGQRRTARPASGITRNRCRSESSSSGSLPAPKQKASMGKAGFIHQRPVLPCRRETAFPELPSATAPGISPSVSATGQQGLRAGHVAEKQGWKACPVVFRSIAGFLRGGRAHRRLAVGDKFIPQACVLIASMTFGFVGGTWGRTAERERSPALIFSREDNGPETAIRKPQGTWRVGTRDKHGPGTATRT